MFSKRNRLLLHYSHSLDRCSRSRAVIGFISIPRCSLPPCHNLGNQQSHTSPFPLVQGGSGYQGCLEHFIIADWVLALEVYRLPPYRPSRAIIVLSSQAFCRTPFLLIPTDVLAELRIHERLFAGLPAFLTVFNPKKLFGDTIPQKFFTDVAVIGQTSVRCRFLTRKQKFLECTIGHIEIDRP